MTSYSRDTFRFFYAPTYVELNSEHFSQPGVRVKWQEVVRYMKSVFFDPHPTDPTDSYADQEGGLRFDSTQHKFKYRDNVNWKYFGTGDGDVKYDDQGTNGVAKAQYRLPRWSARTGGNYIDSSRVTISDTDVVETPQTFISTNGGTGAQYGFLVRRISAGVPTWAIGNDGTMWWNNDTSMIRDTAGSLSLQTTDGRIQLTDTGNTRFVGRKFLGGQGNNSRGYIFRAPVYTDNFGFAQSPSSGSVGIGSFNSSNPYTLTINGNSLVTDGDMLEWTVFWQTDNTSFAKRFRVTFFGTDVLGSIGGGATYAGVTVIRILRQSSTNAILHMTGTYEGNVLGSPNAQAFSGSANWTSTITVPLYIEIAGDGSTAMSAGIFKLNGGNVITKCQ